ncbi:MAG: type II toxin-antitoxin system RelE/ParE family toxin [Gemmataceae bacterium]
MPTPRTVQLKRSAYTDIGELFGFVIERSGARSANSWRTALLQRLETLGERADIWPLTDDAELASLGVRELLFRRNRFVYRIFYKIEDEYVLVHRIRSASQDQLTPDDL